MLLLAWKAERGLWAPQLQSRKETHSGKSSRLVSNLFPHPVLSHLHLGVTWNNLIVCGKPGPNIYPASKYQVTIIIRTREGWTQSCHTMVYRQIYTRDFYLLVCNCWVHFRHCLLLCRIPLLQGYRLLFMHTKKINLYKKILMVRYFKPSSSNKTGTH